MYRPSFHSNYNRYNRYSHTRTRRAPTEWFILLLLQQIQQLEHKPPVTITVVAFNILVHLNLAGILPFDVPSVRQACLKPSAILYRGEFSRLFWGTVTHADDYHLYYNMGSLLVKGAQLEPSYGSFGFAVLLVELMLTSNVLYLVLAAMLPTNILLIRMIAGRNLMNTCAVGFSGVLFGLKVILTHDSPGWGTVAGFSVPVKYLAWAELVFIQFITPNASFLGHACGILAGLLHLYVFKPILYQYRMQRRRSYRY